MRKKIQKIKPSIRKIIPSLLFGMILSQNVTLDYSEIDLDSSNIHISYSSDSDIYGFQLQITGLTVLDATSDLMDCSINTDTGGIACLDISGGGYLPSGDV